ncbi:MAG TPA: TolC family outer membrane protein [Paracoccus solventivorans]|uniref:TolC family outer membrane protein n=1 Tax=Paracoccus solventivorans TaxID=53463 RepID=A0A832PKF9_9RHOB|nr:TolC family outer membrane protein [Paracoccus solventivorans]HHW33214.1 TolC family outer membrane protein [Paracoccus solventivorans]
MIRRRLAAAALALGTLLSSPAAWAESLADTLVGAYRHSALIEQNRAVLRAADEDVAAAMASLRPVVQWAAAHNFQQVDGAEGVSSSLEIAAQMTLFDWGRNQLAIDIAKEQVLATRESLVAVEQDVLLGAVRAFLDVRSAEQQVALQENSVTVLTRERQAAQDRFDVGEITSTDVALAEAQLAASRAARAAAQGQLEIARESYRAAVGRAPGRLDPPPPLPKRPASLESAQDTARGSHPAIRQSKRTVAAAELGVAAAAAERSPTITGSVGLSTTRSSGDSIALGRTTQDPSTLRAGIQANQTLYSGGRLPAVHRRAMAQRDSARSALLNISRQVDESVAVAWANIDVARAQIGAIDEQISAAQQAYEGVREEAMLGARTTLDVLDAEQNLLQARADKITAEANLQLAHYQLLASMGLLTVEHLKLGIPTYDPSAYYNAVRNAPYTSTQGENLDRVLRAIGKQPRN